MSESTERWPGLPADYRMVGPCGNSTPQRQLLMIERVADGEATPYLLWHQQQLPPKLKASKTVVHTFANQMGESAIMNVQGLTLDQVLQTTGALPPVLAARWALNVAENAIYFHKQRIYADSKRYAPSTLRVSSQGSLSVQVDPQIARAAPPIDAALLPVNEPSGVASDVFYVGALLALMLRGSIPNPTPIGQALPASVPSALQAIVRKATDSNPKQRYQSAEELHAALLNWLQKAKAPVKPKRDLTVWLIGLLLTVGTLALIWWYTQRQQEGPPIALVTPVAQPGSGTPALTPTPTAPSAAQLIDIVEQVLINQVVQTSGRDVEVYVSVLNNNEPIANIPPENFTVLQNNIPITQFTAESLAETNAPVQVMLVMDTSGSMGPSRLGLNDGALDTAIGAAQDFLDNLPPNSEVGLIQFSNVVTVEQTLTADIAHVRNIIGTFKAGGQTAVYDALDEAVRQLGTTNQRAFIVLLSDGGDTASRIATREQVSAAARRTNLPIYTIGLTSAEFDDAVLRGLAEQSGALFLDAPSREALDQLYTTVFKQIKGQYRITYTSPVPFTAGETIDVEVKIDDGRGTVVTNSKVLIIR